MKEFTNRKKQDRIRREKLAKAKDNPTNCTPTSKSDSVKEMNELYNTNSGGDKAGSDGKVGGVKSSKESNSAKKSKSAKIKPVEVPYGEHYVEGKGKKSLKPNIMYTTPEGYKYTTDSKGRICNVEGVLQKGVAKRNEYAQQNVGKGDGRRDGTEGLGKDDGGHLIASIFKGSGNIDNLVPMNSNLNRGEWKKMENAWANAVYNKDGIGRKVEVKITPIYMDSSQCPT